MDDTEEETPAEGDDDTHEIDRELLQLYIELEEGE